MRSSVSLVLAALVLVSSPTPAAAEVVDVLSLEEGTLPVVEPSTYSGWTALNVIDPSPSSGWAAESGHVKDNTFVFELAAPATIERFEFDTASNDGDGRGARHVVVAVSATGKDSGFVEVARGELADRADGQKLAATKKVPARWVRLTVADNHGDAEWSELMGFHGYGERPFIPPANASGTYESDYGDFHLRQQGTALLGCYEHDDGLLDGTIEGRVMKLTWHEWKLTIEGHTDASGSAAHNQTLSEQRAAAVKAYLVGKGIDAARLNTAGFGASRPVAANASELGRAQNRRVELVKC